jgi:hypothetical protein
VREGARHRLRDASLGDRQHDLAGFAHDHLPYFLGTFDASGAVLDGGWVYPGVGGYHSTMTRTSA